VAALHDDFRSPTARPHHRRIQRIGLDLAEQFGENGFDLLITAASNRPRRHDASRYPEPCHGL
jgi:hypothetical protein